MAARVFSPINQLILLQLTAVQDGYIFQTLSASKSSEEVTVKPLLMTDSAGGSFRGITTVANQQSKEFVLNKYVSSADKNSLRITNKASETQTALAAIQSNVDPSKWVAKQVFKRNNAGAKQTGMIEFGKHPRKKSRFFKLVHEIKTNVVDASSVSNNTKQFTEGESKSKHKRGSGAVGLKGRHTQSKQDLSDNSAKSKCSLMSILGGNPSLSNLHQCSSSSQTKTTRPSLENVIFKSSKSKDIDILELSLIQEETGRLSVSKSPVSNMRTTDSKVKNHGSCLKKQSSIIRPGETKSPKTKPGNKQTPPNAVKSKPGQLKMGKTLSSIFGTEDESSPKVSAFETKGSRKPTKQNKTQPNLTDVGTQHHAKRNNTDIKLGLEFLDSDMEPENMVVEAPANMRNAVKKKSHLLKIPDKLNSSFELAIPSETREKDAAFLKMSSDTESQIFYGFSSYLI
jgi:hypothetical protein